MAPRAQMHTDGLHPQAAARAAAAAAAGWQLAASDDYRNLATQDLQALGDGTFDVGATEDWFLSSAASMTSVDLVNGTGLVVVMPAVVGGAFSMHCFGDLFGAGGILEGLDSDSKFSLLVAATAVSGFPYGGTNQTFRPIGYRGGAGGGTPYILNHLGQRGSGFGWYTEVNDGSGGIVVKRTANPVTENVAFQFELILQGLSCTTRRGAFSGTFAEPETLAVEDRFTLVPESPNVGAPADPWDPTATVFPFQHHFPQGSAGTTAYTAHIHGVKVSKLVTA